MNIIYVSQSPTTHLQMVSPKIISPRCSQDCCPFLSHSLFCLINSLHCTNKVYKTTPGQEELQASQQGSGPDHGAYSRRSYTGVSQPERSGRLESAWCRIFGTGRTNGRATAFEESFFEPRPRRQPSSTSNPNAQKRIRQRHAHVPLSWRTTPAANDAASKET